MRSAAGRRSSTGCPLGCAFAERCPFADDACRAAPIPMTEIAPGRAVRCIRPLTGDPGRG